MRAVLALAIWLSAAAAGIAGPAAGGAPQKGGPGWEAYSRALAFWTAQMYELAYPEIHEAIRQAPGDPRYRAGLAWMLIEDDRHDEAFVVLSEALQGSPDDPELSLYLGRGRQETGDVPGAIAAFEKAVAGNPDSVEAHLWLARSRYRLAERTADAGERNRILDAAIPEFLEALSRSPNAPIIHYQLAEALLARGELEQALEHVRIVARLRPDHPQAAQRVREVEQLVAAQAAREASGGP